MSEESLIKAAEAISPRGARHGWMPDECRAFEEMDRGYPELGHYPSELQQEAVQEGRLIPNKKVNYHDS